MTLSIQSNTIVQLPVWLTPVGYAVAVALLQSIFIPTINAPVITQVLMASLVNSVTLLAVLTACFWAALRIVHNKAHSAMLGYLLDQNSLSQFAAFRRRAQVRLRNHCIAALTAAVICFPLVFTVLPDLVLPATLQRMIMLGCLFTAWLYLFQGISLARFLYRHFLTQSPDSLHTMKCQQQVSDVVKILLLASMILLLLLPLTAVGNLPYAQLGIGFSTGLAIMILTAFNVLFSAQQKARAYQHHAISRIDTKLYFLQRQSKYRKDALEHAMARLRKEKKGLQRCQCEPVTFSMQLALAAWSVTVPVLWWLVSA